MYQKDKVSYLHFYYSAGLTPIPLFVNSKRPVVENWTTLGRDELLKRLEKHDGNVGLRIERPIFIIDIDEAKLSSLILDEIPPTWMVETRRGMHIYAKSSVNYPQNNKKSRLVQLLAEGCQVVAPPSVVDGHEYRFIRGPPEYQIAEVDGRAMEKLTRILEALAKHEVLIHKLAELWTEGHRHNLSLWLNGALRKAGIDKFEAAVVVKSICLLAEDRELNDRLTTLKTTYERPIDEVAGWSYLERELISIVGPEKAGEILNLLPRPVKTEEKQRLVRLSAPMDLDGAHFEQIEDGLLKIDRDGQITVGEIIDNHVRDSWLNDIVVLPPAPEKVDSIELWNRVKNYIKTYVYHENEQIFDVLTSFVFWSYFADSNEWTPYLFIHGPFGTGKSRLLETLRLLTYRSLLSSIARGPSLFRTIERLGAVTLIIDEANHFSNDLRDLLRVGYRKNNYIVRADKTEHGIELHKFATYCLKFFAHVDEPSEDIKQRSVAITMTRAPSPPPKKFDLDEARRIRAGLFYYRLRSKIEVTGEEYHSIYGDSRLEEIASPLVRMAMEFNPGAVQTIKAFFEEEEKRRMTELSSSDEAILIEALLRYIEENGEITYISNATLQSLLEWEPRKIGRLMSRLGFEKIRKARERGYLLSLERLHRLAVLYGLEPYYQVTMT